MATAPSQVQPQDAGEEIAIAHGCGQSRQDQEHGRDPIGPHPMGGEDKQLETQFDEKKISDPLKVAIVTSALPNKVQDHIFSQASSKDPTFDQVKELILLYVARMENCGGPTPMDVGNMQRLHQNQQQRKPCGHQDHGWQEDDGDAHRYPWDMNMWDHPQATPWSEEVPLQEDHSAPFQGVNGIQDAIC